MLPTKVSNNLRAWVEFNSDTSNTLQHFHIITSGALSIECATQDLVGNFKVSFLPYIIMCIFPYNYDKSTFAFLKEWFCVQREINPTKYSYAYTGFRVDILRPKYICRHWRIFSIEFSWIKNSELQANFVEICSLWPYWTTYQNWFI